MLLSTACVHLRRRLLISARNKHPRLRTPTVESTCFPETPWTTIQAFLCHWPCWLHITFGKFCFSIVLSNVLFSIDFIFGKPGPLLLFKKSGFPYNMIMQAASPPWRCATLHPWILLNRFLEVCYHRVSRTIHGYNESHISIIRAWHIDVGSVYRLLSDQ
jgi:hypothetical protein